MNNPFIYPGTELDVFRLAKNWKRYVRNQILPYLKGDVLEVGAGIGSMTSALYQEAVRRWVCLEPDARHVQKIQHRLSLEKLDRCEVRQGMLADFRESGFDAILYMDVLEHIELDAAELERASGLLKEGGHLIVLAPAHPWLYSGFDRQVGHFRRYHRKTLHAIAPLGVRHVRTRYLDSFGLMASTGNRILNLVAPSRRQIIFWDRVLVPLSRKFDSKMHYRIGKSILTVWKR